MWPFSRYIQRIVPTLQFGIFIIKTRYGNPLMAPDAYQSLKQKSKAEWRYPVDLPNKNDDLESSSSRDTTAIVIFIGLICLLLILTGYLVWRGAQLLPDLREMRKPAKKTTTKSQRSEEKTDQMQPAPSQWDQADPKQKIAILKQRGLKLARSHHYAQAEQMYRMRLELILQHRGQAHPSVPSAMTDLALVIQGQDRTDEAEVLYHQIFALLLQNGDQESEAAAVASEGLAQVYLVQGKLNEIDPLYLQAIQIWDRIKGPDNLNTISLQEQRARLLNNLGRHEEVEVLEHYLARVKEKQGGKTGTETTSRISENRRKKISANHNNNGEGNATIAGLTRVQISISNSFKPVRMTVAARSSEQPQLSPERPPVIAKEPLYSGKTQLYGSLELGTIESNIYWYALDLVEKSHPMLYFDKNQNGDLSDDGPPLTNSGRGLFATTISIPFTRLTGDDSLSGDYQLWFFTNKSLWPKKKVRFYSVTQWQGQVDVAGRRLMAIIGERGRNDADFTNDGIYLDLNRNGKIDSNSEYIGPHEALRIAGQSYQFDISW